MPDSPGRAVRMSASGLTSDALIPKAARSWGVATYTGPDQERPAAACWSEALVESSSVTVLEPRALAMLRATAVWGGGGGEAGRRVEPGRRGRARRCGGGGRADSGARIGILVIERAGREAAK